MESLNDDLLHIDVRDVEFVKADMLSKNDFIKGLKQFKQLRFDVKMADTPDASIDFKTSLQPLYHKNFDLVSSSFHQFIDDGYTIYVLSDSEKQQKRLYHILKIATTPSRLFR